MPLFLKDIKKELQKDGGKKGRRVDGTYKYVPPNIVSRKLADYTKLRVLKLDRIYRVGIKSIDYTCFVPSEEIAGVKYRVTVRFLNILFGDKKTDMVDVRAKNVDGSVVYHKTPTIRLNPVMLKCSCPDFRHRFEHELYDYDALIGAPRKYKRKTPLWPVGAPFANSTHKVGVCKHVFSVIEHLKAKKYLFER